MSGVDSIGDERLAKVHDLYLELVRIELLLERNAKQKSVDRELKLRHRHTQLLKELDRLEARTSSVRRLAG